MKPYFNKGNQIQKFSPQKCNPNYACTIQRNISVVNSIGETEHWQREPPSQIKRQNIIPKKLVRYKKAKISNKMKIPR